MDGLGEAAAGYVRGSFVLLVGNFVSMFVMAAGSILVARMLSPSEYGLYSVSLVLPGLFLLFSDWGVNSALTRFLARYRSEGEQGKIWRLERAALLFKFGVGCVLSVALFLSADFLASILLKRPGVGGLVRLASLLVLFHSLHSTVISALSGLERMDLRAAVNVIMALVKGIASPLLVYMGYGIHGPIVGHVSSYLVASLLGVLFMVLATPDRGSLDGAHAALGDGVGLMLGYGMPLFWGGLVAGFAGQLRGFLLSWFVSYGDIGNYHVAVNFTMLIGLVTGSIAVTLFPAFSKLSYFSEPEKARQAFRGSVRYSSMFVIPMICLLAAMSEPMVSILYTTKYPQAPFFLSMLLVPNLLVGAGSLSIGSFLNSQGDTGTSMRVGLVGSVVSILISPVFVWMWGIFGLASSIIVSSIACGAFGLYALREKYGLLPDLRHASKTLLSSAVSAGVSFGVVRVTVAGSPFISLFLGSCVFLLAFLFLASFMRVIEEGDIGNLDSMLKGMAVIYPFARLLLEFERRIIRLTLRRRAD
jgi:stage V sporulation protein B